MKIHAPSPLVALVDMHLACRGIPDHAGEARGDKIAVKDAKQTVGNVEQMRGRGQRCGDRFAAGLGLGLHLFEPVGQPITNVMGQIVAQR